VKPIVPKVFKEKMAPYLPPVPVAEPAEKPAADSKEKPAGESASKPVDA
jgi:hypothetical protein